MLKLITLSVMLIAENNKCIDFSPECNKEAIVELRDKCPNIQENLGMISSDRTSIWIMTGRECVEAVPNNAYVKKYVDLLEIVIPEEE